MTSFDPHANFAYSTVGTAPSPASSGTTLSVQAGDGALFPDPAVLGAYNVVVASAGGTTVAAEICRVTARSTDLLTLTRATESSSARAIAVGDPVFLAITAKSFTDIQAAVTTLESTVGTTAAGYQYAYAEFTASVTVSGTTVSSANTVVSAGTVTFSGSTAVSVDFFVPAASTGTSLGDTILAVLFDGGTAVGNYGQIITPAAAALTAPFRLTRELTPSAGPHSYNVRAYKSGGNGTLNVGSGGTAAFLPGFIRVTKAA